MALTLNNKTVSFWCVSVGQKPTDGSCAIPTDDVVSLGENQLCLDFWPSEEIWEALCNQGLSLSSGTLNLRKRRDFI